ncbi:hypothetical protein [Cohnella silvisoli]|uniref:Glycosyl hydrolase 36 catalytic domain-containing protein n=1 Tax=Cohnella silvisoli TaxID=2873699 RepID=A0ABV1L0U1_9BACL|nr:hypothetical protein [Cohnella silvisoli]MCD9025039.1 hypothetical protein [Cohnella silvisoli]
MRAKLQFQGSEAAEHFSRQLEESFLGIVRKNLIADPAQGPVGFVAASVDGRYWSDTMWSRDQGTFMRELIHYGEFELAKAAWQASVDHVALNREGYYSFPMYVYPNQPRSGEEMDGTTVWLVSSFLLWERLPAEDAVRYRIEKYLLADTSPLRYILFILEKQPFVSGCGEFGGGIRMPTQPFYNVVQNGMVAMMLEFAGTRLKSGTRQAEALELGNRCLRTAAGLKESMLNRMVFEDGSWIWCLDPDTGRQAADEILNDEGNKGFAGINGILTHSSDVYGFMPLTRGDGWFVPASVQTFYKLLTTSHRMERFAKYGMFSQFDLEWEGNLTSASYGQGYAIQCMLLLDRPELYTKAVQYLIDATLEPVYPVTRDSRFWFYERYLCPDSEIPDGWEEGCGALNLVNVTEPLKCARLMLGVDDTGMETVSIVPRLPVGWTFAEATGLPVRTPSGYTRIDIRISSDSEGSVTSVTGEAADALPELRIRLGTAVNPSWHVVEPGMNRFAAN